MIQKEIIKYNPNGSNLNVVLNNNDGYLGVQQEINNLLYGKSDESINDVDDGEVLLTTLNRVDITFQFKFLIGERIVGNVSTPYYNSRQDSLNNPEGCFIFDFYDTYDVNNQTKLFSTYINDSKNTEHVITANNKEYPIFKYSVDKTSDLYSLSIPLSAWNNVQNKTFLYFKTSYYNRTNGDYYTFYPESNELYMTHEKTFTLIEIDYSRKQWEILNNNQLPNIEFIENRKRLAEVNQYTQKMSNTINTQNILNPSYPAGNMFDVNSRSYIENE